MVPIRQKNFRNKENVEAVELPTTPVGEVLRQAREAAGITLEMVANELMIRRFYLEAIESGSYQDLPERVYAVGFVGNYLNYMGLDKEALLTQFKRDAFGTRSTGNYQIDLNMPEPVLHSVVPNRSAIIVALVVLCLLIGGGVYLSRGGDDETPTAIPEPAMAGATMIETPDNIQEDTSTSGQEPMFTSAATPAASNRPSATGGIVAQPKQSRRNLEAQQTSWVEIKDENGAILYTGTLKAGQMLPLPDTKKLKVTTANAGGMRLVVDGQPQPVLGKVGELKRDIAIGLADEILAAGER